MKKNYKDFQIEYSKINILEDFWLEKSQQLLEQNHLICFGKNSDLQWFGTSLIQKSGQIDNSEISSIYGKLASNFDDFCYQLCHSTPWGFEMGRNLNAVNDVLRGEYNPNNKFLIWYNADILYQKEFENFKQIFEIILNQSEEEKEKGKLFRVILLFNQEEVFNVRKLLKNKEKYPIALRKITTINNI
jgi:hypothetical protein